jgi:crossover junction endodeoxyribonuclease RusA
VNRYWQNRVIRGRKPFVQTYISAAGQTFRENVLAAALAKWGRIKPTSSRLRVSITAVMPDRRTRDIDNIVKPTLDAITHAGVWQDDSQIDELRVVRGHVQVPGWIDVTIERIPQPETQKTLFPVRNQ